MTTNRPKDASELLKVDSKPRDVYRRFSLAHLTAYSVYWLSCWEMHSTYENISVLNARLFPQDFGLTGFPGMPNAMRTNRCLLQLRPKYRGLATSDPRKGVFLTEKGRSEVVKVIQVLGTPTFEGKPVDVGSLDIDPRRPSKSREHTRNPISEIEKAKSKLLYQLYKDGHMADADVVHFLGLVELYDHTPPSEIRKQVRQLRSDGETTKDREFLEFLDVVSTRFAGYINRSDSASSKRED
ncbi:MAG: hypothetical protein KJ626_03115 [Verrucomicrobia bacterium]|nr:hypothetical protein [Verrucomicrobiota bacterium]MBU1694619.1 hypothetical protein [Verrucomicrobiota bacterium]